MEFHAKAPILQLMPDPPKEDHGVVPTRKKVQTACRGGNQNDPDEQTPGNGGGGGLGRPGGGTENGMACHYRRWLIF